MVRHTFTFETAEEAGRFTERLKLRLDGIAIWRDPRTRHIVEVWDPEHRTNEIARLARESGSTVAKI